jgi:hypothetical protein
LIFFEIWGSNLEVAFVFRCISHYSFKFRLLEPFFKTLSVPDRPSIPALRFKDHNPRFSGDIHNHQAHRPLGSSVVMAFGFKGSRVVGRSNAVFCAWHPKKSDGTIQSESEKIVAEHVFLDIYIYIYLSN